MPEWGTKLQSFLFQNPSALLANEISQAVKDTLLQYEPRIRVEEVDVHFSEDSSGRADIQIQFFIPKTNSRHNHVYPFSLIEGTNLISAS